MEQIWNEMTKAARKRLLTMAGYNHHYAQRAFAFIPSWVRDDITYTFKRATVCA
jgi:hypothetical protein